MERFGAVRSTVWRDLCLVDNPALTGSLQTSGPVLLVFLWSPNDLLCYCGDGGGLSLLAPPGSTATQPISGEDWQPSCDSAGNGFLLRGTAGYCHGDSGRHCPGKCSVRALVAGERRLESQGVRCQLHHSYCLREPISILALNEMFLLPDLPPFCTGIGSVTHFMSCSQQNPGSGIGAPLPASQWPQSCELDQLGLARMPHRKDNGEFPSIGLHSCAGSKVDWAATIRRSWDFSEDGAYTRLQAFLSDDVDLGQNYPAQIMTDLRAQSLQEVALVWQQFALEYVDKQSGCDLVPVPERLVGQALGGGELVQWGPLPPACHHP
ncbi:hypothetical protein AOXY_G18271 [Acipenser oxyrinchus oxyrinchus]|uniref:Uncharacterized protein n=1 Tax=Acipenser oxyrinchus oxyrinchus TaxID=40147 RepID=A0AAD8G1U3_ACIOX|nr:hypothetical protein AOXY_G18271 [Acipenser oxyrinchus oxyrinchus]